MNPATAPNYEDAPRVLTSAVVKAADLLGISQLALSKIIGVSPSTVSRMRSHTRLLNPNDKHWELALLFVRLFRSLDAMMGGDDRSAREWLSANNRHLHGKPVEMIKSITGLTQVVAHVDAYRAKI